MAALGLSKDVTQEAYNDSLRSIKENLRAIEQSLTGDWLVGNKVTLADIFIIGTFNVVFQVNLDQGFVKAAPKVCAWFNRVSSLPEFIAVFGKIRMAKKGLKPVIKAEEKQAKKGA